MTDAASTRLRDYLDHIQQAISRIDLYISGMGRDEFLENLLLQDAVIRNLEILGEASRNIVKSYPDFAEANPSLPLRDAYEMRNALAHGYFEVDMEIVWRTIVHDLPEMARHIATRRGADVTEK